MIVFDSSLGFSSWMCRFLLVSYWCIGCRYVVCNPATNKWLLLPDNLHSCDEARLWFDPIVSSHFHMFEYEKMREGESIGVRIYSSNSATWIFKESKWGDCNTPGVKASLKHDTSSSCIMSIFYS
jgi:hypothetical protein